MKSIPIIALSFLLVSAGLGYSQMNHADHGAQSEMGARGAGLTEAGQGAFAALSEAVRLLEADPDTEWSTVDVRGLRDHLVDMDRLVTHSVVREVLLEDGVRAVAGGDAATLATLRRMVPAHAGELATDDRWSVTVSDQEDTVELLVTSDDPAVAARIRGLGFFGLMASQDHHRAHHLRMLRGEDAHKH